jgi:hypothetical protein
MAGSAIMSARARRKAGVHEIEAAARRAAQRRGVLHDGGVELAGLVVRMRGVDCSQHHVACASPGRS